MQAIVTIVNTWIGTKINDTIALIIVRKIALIEKQNSRLELDVLLYLSFTNRLERLINSEANEKNVIRSAFEFFTNCSFNWFRNKQLARVYLILGN